MKLTGSTDGKGLGITLAWGPLKLLILLETAEWLGRQRYKADTPRPPKPTQPGYINPTHATFPLLHSLQAISGRQESHDGGRGGHVTSGHAYLCTHTG
jgi:hypothetical protein